MTLDDSAHASRLRVMAREYQQWAKNCATFVSTGPRAASAGDVPIDRATMARRGNGRGECASSTAYFRRPFEDLIAFITAFMTLEAGNLSHLRFPAPGVFSSGGVIEAKVGGIGAWRSPYGRQSRGSPVRAGAQSVRWKVAGGADQSTMDRAVVRPGGNASLNGSRANIQEVGTCPRL